MNLPQIQYTKSSDGASIAYAVAGAGKPLIMAMPPPWSVLSGLEMYRYFWEQLVGDFRVLMFDWRGTGFSDRSVIDFSMESLVLDIEAAAAKAGDEPFAVVTYTTGTPVVLAYSAKHPGRVSHFMLCDPWITFSDFANSPARAIEVSVRDKDWELLTETFAQVLWRYEDQALAKQFAALIRASSTPEAWRAFWEAAESYDASAYVDQVTAPTIVLHNRSNRWVPVEGGQQVAASIPGAADAHR
jgi:pimeloyl-ACP methyl ester carboxylesterase